MPSQFALRDTSAAGRLIHSPSPTREDPPHIIAHTFMCIARKKTDIRAKETVEALESVRKVQTGLQSFRSMRRIEARRKKARPLPEFARIEIGIAGNKIAHDAGVLIP
jgi:hypothetical protein